MKRLICLITVALIFLLTGCTKAPDTDSNTVVFYYIYKEIEYGTSSGVIRPSVVEVKEDFGNYEKLLAKYFNGPTNYDCISPFPAGITLEGLEIDRNKAQILLSPHLATISGSQLTVALACLTRTVIEMTDVQTVEIRIQDNQINGADSLTLSLNNFTYFDDTKSNYTK